MDYKKKYLKYKQKYFKLKAGSNSLYRTHRMNIIDPETGDIVSCDKNEINIENDKDLNVINPDTNMIVPINSYEPVINTTIELNSYQNFEEPDIREVSFIELMYEEFDKMPINKVDEINLRKNNGINLLSLSTHNLGGQTIVTGYDELNREIKEYVNQDRGRVIMTDNTNLEYLRNNLQVPYEYNMGEFSKYDIPQHICDICFYQEYQHQNIDLNTVNQNNLRHYINNNELFVERQKDLAFRINGDDIVSENNAIRRDLKRFYRCPLKLNINENGYDLDIEIFNFHGGIFSHSTSINQLKSNLNILSFIAYNSYAIIVAGDFNIDLLKQDYIIEYYDMLMNESSEISDYLKKEIDFIRVLEDIRQAIHTNYRVYPKTQIKTNIWSLNHNIGDLPQDLLQKKQFEIANKCVDYILIPKRLEPYILDEKFSVDSNVMATPELHQQLTQQQMYNTMGNDFDHSVVCLDLVFNHHLECKLIPI